MEEQQITISAHADTVSPLITPDMHSLLESCHLTPEERNLALQLLQSPDRVVTRYRLAQQLPQLSQLKQSGFQGIVDRLSAKLQPHTTLLGWEQDATVFPLGGLGVIVMSRQDKEQLSKGELHERYWEKLLALTRLEVEADVLGNGVDLASWEAHHLDGHSFYLHGINTSDTDDKYVGVLSIKHDPQPYVGVLTSHRQYQALRIMLAHNGYIDPLVALRNGGPSNLRHILDQLNSAFHPMLGRNLFDTIPNTSKGYALNADIRAKTAHIGAWIDLANLNIYQLLSDLPELKIFPQTAQPYTPEQRPWLDTTQARFFDRLNSGFTIVHIPSLIRYSKFGQGFDLSVDKPYLFIYQQGIYKDYEVPRREQFAIEITEAEALTLLLFREEQGVDTKQLGLSVEQRGRARERYKSFMIRLERMGLHCDNWDATRRMLVFPSSITPVARSE